MLDEPIAIDAGEKKHKTEIFEDIKSIIDPSKIKKVLLTHLHYDHIGNLDLFSNADIFAHEAEIKAYHEHAFGSVLSDDHITVKLKPLPKQTNGLEVIHTPGHTGGSTCFFLKDKGIMFSGDTLFFKHIHGRTDLPTSIPDKMEESLALLYQYDIKILCPGHDY